MSDLNAEEYKTFESIKQIREDGTEFWSARKLQVVLQYKKWEHFSKVIDKAKLACKNSGFNIDDDFPDVRKIVEAGATQKEIVDFELSRYACYLIVQNGNPRKEIIALGQTYFAIQTRRQEVADYFNQLDEDNKRLVIRGDIKQWNQMLVEVAHNSGVITNEEYATFQNAGYMGLYGGLTVEDIHKRKNLKEKEKINTAEKATETHHNVGKIVRKAMKEAGGTMPEDMPTPEKSVSEIEKEQLKNLKKNAKKLMLDE
ncbi:MAG: DNA damage-inducible protein D [Oscillospiraceae bacterium]|nr:DNA damage-inducible protein D [Oscillospiraceae bacterium]